MVGSRSAGGVVVGVDGSAPSNAAVDWATREAVMRGVPLTLACIQPFPLEMMWPVPMVAPEFTVRQQAYGNHIVQRAQQIVAEALGEDCALEVNREIMVGSIVPSLVDLSKGADMVVVGCRGQGPIGRRLLGSVSSGLLHHARCPVAVIHNESRAIPASEHGPVLVGIDGSPASETATAIAFDEASRRGVRLQALHVWGDWSNVGLPGFDVSRAAAQAELALAERLAGWQERYPDVAVDRILVCGPAAEHLLSHAESAQLVVVGSHGRGGFAGMLLGSVSTAVAESASVPVIVARHS